MYFFKCELLRFKIFRIKKCITLFRVVFNMYRYLAQDYYCWLCLVTPKYVVSGIPLFAK